MGEVKEERTGLAAEGKGRVCNPEDELTRKYWYQAATNMLR